MKTGKHIGKTFESKIKRITLNGIPFDMDRYNTAICLKHSYFFVDKIWELNDSLLLFSPIIRRGYF